VTGKHDRSDEAFAAFVAVAWDRHLSLAVLLTGDLLRGEELLQDCLVKLYVRWRKLSDPEQAHAYLRRMLANGEVSSWRRRRREHLVAEPPDRVAPPVPSDFDDRLRRALMELPARARAVVVMRHYLDLSEAAVAEILGCSIGTVKSQNARGLQRLQQSLSADPRRKVPR
jgi:RNA polymerase sigma-70 factor (sigma-E family)